MQSPSPEHKSLLVATIAAGIYADPQSWRDFEHEALENEGWDAWVLRKAKKVAFKIWKECR